MVDTIDITPEGAKTPDGIARINAAVENKTKVDARARELLSELVDEFGAELRGLLRGSDLYDDIKAILRETRAADETFLRALAGQDP